MSQSRVSAFLRLILRNALRNPRRTLLTGTSVAISLFLLVSLQTLLTEIKGETMLSEQSQRRLLTRSAVSLDIPLPLAYKARLERIPGVEIVSEYQWVMTYHPEPRDMIIIVACDPRFVGTDPEVYVTPHDVQAFRDDRTAVIVPVKMMRRFGWHVGDRVILPGTVFPFDLQLTIRGTFTAIAQNFLVCHYSLFNELLRQRMPSRADKTMAFFMRTESPQVAARVAREIDDMFRNSPAPTRTESERSFLLGFSEMLGNVRVFISMIAVAVIFAIALVTTNTMSMAVRERTHEIAMLKALGFTPTTVMMLIVGESLAISFVGGIIGVAGARLFFSVFDIYDLTSGVVQHFQITGAAMLEGVLLALVMSIVSSVIPAARGVSRPIAGTLRAIG